MESNDSNWSRCWQVIWIIASYLLTVWSWLNIGWQLMMAIYCLAACPFLQISWQSDHGSTFVRSVLMAIYFDHGSLFGRSLIMDPYLLAVCSWLHIGCVCVCVCLSLCVCVYAAFVDLRKTVWDRDIVFLLNCVE